MSEGLSFRGACSRRVSFILATKNRADYIEKTLDSIQRFKTSRDELIVVDGGSTDATLEMLQKSRQIVDVLISEPDLSAAHALNKGMLLSRGQYIRQVCDDDVLHSEELERAINVLEQNPDIDLLVCGGTKQHGHNRVTVCLPPGIGYGKSVRSIFEHSGSGVGFVIRRSSLAKLGLMHPTGPESDLEFVLEAVTRGAVVKFCRVNLYEHPVLEHSYSVRLRREFEKYHVRLAKQYGSPSFYFKTLILSLSRRYPLFGPVALPFRLLDALRRRGVAGMARRAGMRGSGADECESAHIWDGGLS